MITRKQNERLTQVGRGTPAGELLRRYWQPVLAAAVLKVKPVSNVMGADYEKILDQ